MSDTLIISEVVAHQLPRHINVPENDKFITLLKKYYDWSIQNGQPADFIHKLLEYRDVDLTNDEYRLKITQSLLDVIPNNSKVDRATLTKHIREFLSAKGNLTSFNYIMKVIYDEDIDVTFNSNKLFRPSDNNYIVDTKVTIESTMPWSKCVGSMLTQTSPSPAHAIISNIQTYTLDGKTMNELTLDNATMFNSFSAYGSVESLHNDINRSWYKEEEYYEPLSLIHDTITFFASEEEKRPYEDHLIKQLGSDFRGTVESFVSRDDQTGGVNVTLKLKDVTGTYNNNEIYIFPPELEYEMYVKSDYEMGTCSPSISNVNVNIKGDSYTAGSTVKFINGSGVNADAKVQDVSTGPIDSIIIKSDGSGYSVGDTLTINNKDTSGTSATCAVKTTDGLNGKIVPTTSLNSFKLNNSGENFSVGDTIVLSNDIIPATLTVLTVDSAWAFIDTEILNEGTNYPPYTTVALIDTSTTELVPGFDNTISFNQSGGINNISINTIPTISTNTLILSANGYGATATATISAGAMSNIQITNDGVNYINPIVTIIGDGINATANATILNGKISNVTITSGGSDYTTASIVISESLGKDFNATPIFRDQTNSKGTITSLNITTAGEYKNIPNCFNTHTSTSGTGIRLNLDVDFKLNTTKIVNSGKHYKAINTSVSGLGEGVQLNPTITAGVLSISVIHGGNNYYHGTTITCTSSGTNATLTPIIVDGKIKEILSSGGSGYVDSDLASLTVSSGTQATINTSISSHNTISDYNMTSEGYGYIDQSIITPISITTGNNGSGALFYPTINNFGHIINIKVLHGGIGYDNTSTIIIADQDALGLNATATLNVINGQVSSVTMTNVGVNYNYGTYAIVLGNGINGSITPIVENNKIVSLNITNRGSGYTYAEVILVGDEGITADYTLEVNGFGSLDATAITDVGFGYVTNPIISVDDNSGTGSISSLVISGGDGYKKTPVISGGNATLIAKGTKIGGVSHVQITNIGVAYDVLPQPIFPFICHVTNNVPFIIGENVTVTSGASDATGKVLSYDFDRYELVLDVEDDNYNYDINGNTLETTNSITLETTNTITLTIGDEIIGSLSNVKTTIERLARASGTSIQGGSGSVNPRYNSDVGILNNGGTKLADNDRYHDYAYVVESGLSLSDYESLLKKTVHPVGYALFANTNHHTTISLDILNEIGDNVLLTLFILISISDEYKSGTEYTRITDIFGDFNKFKFQNISMKLVKDLKPFEVTDVFMKNYNEYNAPILAHGVDDFVAGSGLLTTLNVDEAPDGSNNLIRLTDTSTTGYSRLYKTVPTAIGDTITFEVMIKKDTADNVVQIRLNHPIVSLMLNKNTGEYFSNSPNDILDVTSLGEFWYIRMMCTATGTSIYAAIFPAIANIDNISLRLLNKTGSVDIFQPIVKNITNIGHYSSIIRAKNPKYLDDKIYILDTEAQIVTGFPGEYGTGEFGIAEYSSGSTNFVIENEYGTGEFGIAEYG